MTALLVAGSGGHLEQLVRLVRRIPDVDADDAMWVSYDGAQSRSLLSGRDVAWAEYPPPRNVSINARNALLARRLLKSQPFDLVVSTGASIAVAFLPIAARRGIAAHYIESATRIEGPSMTGRILQRVPRVRTWCQYRSWAKGPWRYAGSVFEGFVAELLPEAQRKPPSRFVVTVGSSEVYGFRRLLERMVKILPDGADVLWQTGPTDVRGLGIDAREVVPGDELRAAVAAADVVVSHAGIGSALTALDTGRCPVLVPRSKAHGEHVDDHQAEITRLLGDRGLVIARRPEELFFEDLERAAGQRIVDASEAPPILLS